MIILRQKSFAYDKKTDAAVGVGVGGTAIVGGGMAYKPIKDKYHAWLDSQKKPQQDYSSITGKVGDRISISRSGGKYEHWGVITEVDPKTGKILRIMDYSNPYAMDARKMDVAERDIQTFAGKQGGKITVHASNSNLTADQLRERANNLRPRYSGSNYHILNNNCEHFANELVTGKRVSHQANKVRNGSIIRNMVRTMRPRVFSAPQKQALELLNDQKAHLLNEYGFKIRKGLSRDLGGLSHFQRNQTNYIAGSGSVAGGVIGQARAKRKAKRDAEAYGLKKGTLEYDNFIKQRRRAGLIKGAAVGGGIGFAGSKGIDTIRGKVISDKLRASGGMDLGKNYVKTGKSLRGIKSEEDVNRVVNNWKEIGDYAKANIKTVI